MRDTPVVGSSIASGSRHRNRPDRSDCGGGAAREEDAARVHPPIALGRHRSCPDRPSRHLRAPLYDIREDEEEGRPREGAIFGEGRAIPPDEEGRGARARAAVANAAADLLERLEDEGVEVLPTLSESSSIEMRFDFDTFSNDFSMEYDRRLARDTQSYSVDASEVTVKMANTRQYPLHHSPSNVSTLGSQMSDLQDCYQRLSDADLRTLATADSTDSYDLQEAFKVFTSYVSNKLTFRKKERRHSTAEESFDKMVFM